jgi:hypothetical protein
MTARVQSRRPTHRAASGVHEVVISLATVIAMLFSEWSGYASSRFVGRGRGKRGACNVLPGRVVTRLYVVDFWQVVLIVVVRVTSPVIHYPAPMIRLSAPLTKFRRENAS